MNIYPTPQKATEKVFVVAHCGVGPTGEHYLDMHRKHLAGTTGIREMTAKDMPILQDVADISRSMGKDIDVEQVFDELNTCKAGAIVEVRKRIRSILLPSLKRESLHLMCRFLPIEPLLL